MSALVTGAASGMGRLAALRLAAAGRQVCAVDVDPDGLAATALRNPAITPVVADVCDADALTHAVEVATATGGAVDHVVHAAAICPIGLLEDCPPETLGRVLEVNVVGSAQVAAATLPGMLAAGEGTFVQFASILGWFPALKVGAYSASKAAVLSWFETLAHEHRDRGVRFLCVCPPLVDTPMFAAASGDDGPRSLMARPPIAPTEVLDAIDVALADDDGDLFCFPGRGTNVAWYLRRFAPNLLWDRMHALERG